MGGFLQTPEVLGYLVKWAARLETFKLHYTYRHDYAEEGLYTHWSLDTLQPILQAHRKSLRYIKIKNINGAVGLERCNMSYFTSLERLDLSYRVTGTDTSLVANLLAPRLSTFRWVLTLEDQQCGEDLWHFQEPQEEWLRALANAAIQCGSSLCEIRVKYRPVLDFYYPGKPDGVVYPWARMDRIAKEVEPHGIKISYSDPNNGRRWEDFIEDWVLEELYLEDMEKAVLAGPMCLERVQLFDHVQ